MTLHGWPDSAATLAQISFPPLRAEGACGSRGWETAHGGTTTQLLPAAKEGRFLLIGTESSSVPSASSVDLENKAMIGGGQKFLNFDAAGVGGGAENQLLNSKLSDL